LDPTAVGQLISTQEPGQVRNSDFHAIILRKTVFSRYQILAVQVDINVACHVPDEEGAMKEFA
jgi:hypothetical protein